MANRYEGPISRDQFGQVLYAVKDVTAEASVLASRAGSMVRWLEGHEDIEPDTLDVLAKLESLDRLVKNVTRHARKMTRIQNKLK